MGARRLFASDRRTMKEHDHRVLGDSGPVTSNPKITVVTLNWNAYEETKRCLASLQGSDYPSFDILVVDNGSRDQSADRIQEAFPAIQVIRNEENLGFSAGNNVGIKAALADGADYVFLINNDAELDSKTLSELVHAALADPSIGILGALVYKRDQPGVIEHAGGRLNLALGYNGKARGFGQVDRGQFKAMEQVEWVSGCALMVSRSFVASVGLLDPDYFCYCEDVDWCLRARIAGFKVIIVPSAKVWHKGASSSGSKGSSLSIYCFVRNQMLLCARYAPLRFGVARRLREAVILVSTLAFVARSRSHKGRAALEALRGAHDYHCGRFGKQRDVRM